MTKKGVLLFVPHKAASVFVSNVIENITSIIDMPHIDTADIAYTEGKTEQEVFDDLKQNDTPSYFGPFRRFYFPLQNFDLSKYKIILHTRDPRDCLVSLYFSRAYSHHIPDNPITKEKLLKKREEALSMGIDEFALKEADWVKTFFVDAKKVLDENPDTLISRYEDMILNFPSWLMDLCSYIEAPAQHKNIISLLMSTTFKVEKEDKNKHIRQISSGDFKRKLSPETQEKLNDMFGDLLDTFNYNEPEQDKRVWVPDTYKLVSGYYKTEFEKITKEFDTITKQYEEKIQEAVGEIQLLRSEILMMKKLSASDGE